MPAPIEAGSEKSAVVAAASPILAVEGLSKSFGAVQALKDVSLTLQQGEIRAVCGENGAGKSTFVSLLMGLTQPDAGSITLEGRRVQISGSRHAQSLGLGLVAQELSLAPHLSILDNIWLGSPAVPFVHRRRALREKAREALDTLGVGDWRLDSPVGRLSVGQRQIVEIARLIARDARLLILDEPTATLSDAEIDRMMNVLRTLRAKGRSVLYISHRLGEVFDLCDSVSVFRNGRHISTNSTAALTRDDLVHDILGRTLSEMYPPANPDARREEAVVVQGLAIGDLVRDLSFTARRGEILCIAGQVGSGANLVTRALAGLAPEARGRVLVDGRPAPLRSAAKSIERNVLFISDDRAGEGLFHQLRVLDNIVACSIGRRSQGGVISWPRLRAHAVDKAKQVGLDAERLNSPAGALSGGNQQKILFGRVLRDAEPGVLLLNEPTRGIDVGARSELYRVMRALCAQGYVLIMYSSDLEEVTAMADCVLTIYRGRAVAHYERAAIDGSRILTDITNPAHA
jgi:ABC-type sugar transport system ATPase subunit